MLFGGDDLEEPFDFGGVVAGGKRRCEGGGDFDGGVGEIDFIVCADITDGPSVITEVRGRTVSLETPAEIVAKKVYYRGARLQPLDMFDIAAVAEAYGPDYLVAPLRSCGTEALKKALDVAQSADPQFVSAVIKKLMLREKTSSLAETSQVTTAKLLELALIS